MAEYPTRSGQPSGDCPDTGLPQAMCAHCRDERPSELSGLRVQRRFRAKFAGTCCVRSEHAVEVGDPVAFVGLCEDPDDDSIGVACKRCTALLLNSRR